MADYIDWPGNSGHSYRYEFIERFSADGINAVAGNYMFVKPAPQGGWLPVYIGQAADLKARLPNHERLKDAISAGATQAMAHSASTSEVVRVAEERDLIQRWQPPLIPTTGWLGSVRTQRFPLSSWIGGDCFHPRHSLNKHWIPQTIAVYPKCHNI